ncbi:hypothetical protein WDZ92_39555 [Nostoc sp. NIES-2111]
MTGPFDPPPSSDPVHAIEVSIWDALEKARRVRARGDVPPSMLPALILEEARRAACPSLFRPGLEFSCPEIAQALADAIGRWAQVASAVSPEPGARVPPWPEEPLEKRMTH